VGQEVDCTARFRGQSAKGIAKLEPDSLSFKGAFRLSVPLKDIKSVEHRRGDLVVEFADGTATFQLGRLAEKWALKIRYPRSLIEKLGVKPGARVTVLCVDDATFHDQLTSQTSDVSGRTRKDSDIVFFGVSKVTDLTRLKGLEVFIKRNGAIWAIAPKGKSDIREADVLAAAKRAGLVDIKVVSFSDTLTAHKLVIPVARR
jgi:hypothetical protein